MGLTEDIKAQLSNMSQDQILAAVAKLTAQIEKQKNRAPLTKEQRTAAYVKARGEEGSPERAKWDAKRKEQADKRGAKKEALMSLIREQVARGTLTLSAEQKSLLGI